MDRFGDGADKLGCLPFQHPGVFGYQLVEGESGWTIILSERWCEVERWSELSDKEALYFLAKLRTQQIAEQFQHENRVPGKDFRRILFQRHRKLMGRISFGWILRLFGEQMRELRKRPYDDVSNGIYVGPYRLIETIKPSGSVEQDLKK